MKNEHYFIYQQTKLFYRVYGNGPKSMLAFHGFGQDSEYFAPLAEVYNEYTFYSFDLFFHGQSRWSDENKPLEIEFWATLIGKFLRKNDIDTFSVTGFSLGGKFVLATLSSFAHQIEELVFIAPDGIKTNFWYSLATYPISVRKLFKSFIGKPGRFFTLLAIVRRLGFADKGLTRFAHKQMDTIDKRRRVYYAWVVYRHLAFDLNEIAKLINTHKIVVEMYLGKHDKIITEKRMQTLLSKLDDYDLTVLETGHNFLIRDVAEHLSAAVKKSE